VGSMVLIYSGGYFKSEKNQFGRFGLFTLAFLGSMLGLLYSKDMIEMFIYWELTSLTSFLLIGLKYTDKKTREAARMALLVTAGGGLCLLGGIVLVGEQAQSYQFSDISGVVPSTGAVILFLLGAFTKSAQAPFHFWLPAAMKAPTPASAFLHSAAMVKAGPYLVARLNPIFSQSDLWSTTLVVVGLLSGIIGAWMALINKDLKAILAGLTILALGLLFTLLGVGTAHAMEAFFVFLLAHSLYKSGLFMTTGIVDKKIGTRDIFKLAGAGRLYPLLGLSFVMGVLSLGGVIPTFGFVAKEALIKSMKDSSFFILSLTVLIGLGVGGLRLIVPLIKKSKRTVRVKVGKSLLAPSLICTGLGVILGIFPGVLNWPIDKALKDLGYEASVHLKLWHGFNSTLFISLGVIALSVMVYLLVGRKKYLITKLTSTKVYEQLWRALSIFAGKTTAFWHKSGASLYMYIFFGFALLLVGGVFIDRWGLSLPKMGEYATFYEWATAIVVVLGATVSVRASSILVGVIGLAISGYGISLLFILYSSPDLAITQFLVETMAVILVCFIFMNFPKSIPKRNLSKNMINLSVAVGVGLLATGIMWKVLAYPFKSASAEFYKLNAYTLAHGKNVTNVAIVDFRAFDTLGEAAVLFLAGVGVASLFKLMPGFKNKELE
ncbi:MAG: DUF4040 domain-containing protein, partial [Bacteriovoracaceae bacterium]|nr:DUF4040 domain-containing protein [Bacteriovoracaceae bacterium]